MFVSTSSVDKFCSYLRLNNFVFQRGWRPFLSWLVMPNGTQPLYAGRVCCGTGSTLFSLIMDCSCKMYRNNNKSSPKPAVCSVPTLRLVVEEIVILGDIGDDAEPVRHFHGHHVFWVQQGRNPQLCLSHFKCLR